MGASEDNRVSASIAGRHEARRDLPADGLILDYRTTQRSFGEPGQMRRADQGNIAAFAEIPNQGTGVLPLHRRLGAEYRYQPRPRHQARRLYGWHRTDERHDETRSQMGQY